MRMKQTGSLRRTAQAGFTLIELIVVIVILGILAATALPKFADMGADARLSKIKGARGAVQSAASVAHAKWLVDGSVASQAVILDGNSVSMSAKGYPTAAAAGIEVAASLSSGTGGDFVVAHSGTGSTITADSSHTSCKFTYDETTGAVSVSPVLTDCD